ncbi:MAG TPA: porin family protein [Bacteroidales bacterium]|nr:porin family protein [Bacteroidales bacterium]
MLKKYILSFVVASLFFASAFSQDNMNNIRLGIIANPNVSWLKSDVSRIQGDGSRIGFNIGLMVDKFFAEHYAFTTGLSIHSIGGTLKYRDEKVLNASSEDYILPAGSRVQYNLQYLHIPWGLKFKTTEIGYTTFFGQLGVNTMINIKARANVKGQNISKEGVGEEINLFYMGYHFSGGVEYKIVGNTALILGVTYMNGFTDITQKSDEKTLMHCFEIRLGVVF